MSIRWKLLAAMIGFIVVFVAVLTAIQISVQKDLLEKELENRIVLMKENLAEHGKTLSVNLLNQVQNGLAAYNLSLVNEVLKKTVSEDKVLKYAILMNSAGVAFFHTQRPDLEQEVLLAKEDIFARNQSQFAINEYEKNGESYMEFIVPVQIGTQAWGKLRLGLSKEALNAEIFKSKKEITRQTRQVVLRSLVISLIFIFAGAAIVILIANKFSRPIVGLSKLAGELAKGNFEAGSNIAVDSNDEIGVLAKSFSGMSLELKKSYETMEEHSRTLEQKVKERTADLEILNRKLEELSTTDGLTGIANRRHFDEMLASEWVRSMRLRQSLALALLDVDWFKKYNDYYGHQAGDICLRNVARVLADNVRRAGDMVARYGGEEFAFIAPCTNEDNALSMAQKICEALQSLALPHAVSELGHVTASIGVAVMIPGENEAPDVLVRAADEALYKAKKQGRNRVVIAARKTTIEGNQPPGTMV